MASKKTASDILAENRRRLTMEAEMMPENVISENCDIFAPSEQQLWQEDISVMQVAYSRAQWPMGEHGSVNTVSNGNDGALGFMENFEQNSFLHARRMEQASVTRSLDRNAGSIQEVHDYTQCGSSDEQKSHLHDVLQQAWQQSESVKEQEQHERNMMCDLLASNSTYSTDELYQQFYYEENPDAAIQSVQPNDANLWHQQHTVVPCVITVNRNYENALACTSQAQASIDESQNASMNSSTESNAEISIASADSLDESSDQNDQNLNKEEKCTARGLRSNRCYDQNDEIYTYDDRVFRQDVVDVNNNVTDYPAGDKNVTKSAPTVDPVTWKSQDETQVTAHDVLCQVEGCGQNNCTLPVNERPPSVPIFRRPSAAKRGRPRTRKYRAVVNHFCGSAGQSVTLLTQSGKRSNKSLTAIDAPQLLLPDVYKENDVRKSVVSAYIDQLVLENELITQMSEAYTPLTSLCLQNEDYVKISFSVPAQFPTEKFQQWLGACLPKIKPAMIYPEIKSDIEMRRPCARYTSFDEFIDDTFYGCRKKIARLSDQKEILNRPCPRNLKTGQEMSVMMGALDREQASSSQQAISSEDKNNRV